MRAPNLLPHDAGFLSYQRRQANQFVTYLTFALTAIVFVLAYSNAGYLVDIPMCSATDNRSVLMISGNWTSALLFSVPISLISWGLSRTKPDSFITAQFNAAAVMVFCALIIHFSGGSGESHFPFFILLALLYLYRDWRLIVFGVFFISLHHLLFFWLQRSGYPVIVFSCPDLSTLLIHLISAVFQGIFLCFIVLKFQKIESNRRHLESEWAIFSKAMEFSASGIMITDTAGRIQYANPKFTVITGYTLEEVRGQTPSLLKSDEMSPKLYEEMWLTLMSGREWHGELKNRRKNGELFWCLESLSAICDELGKPSHFVAVIEDINARKFAEESLRQLAYFDPLTGLPNRRHFLDNLAHSLNWRQTSTHYLAVLHMDIDRFKDINDSIGHTTGDLILKHVAHVFETLKRPHTFIGRLGGDEFALILPNIERIEEAAQFSQHILNTLKEPVFIAGQEFFLSLSIGISLYPNDGDSVEGLLKQADSAMYHAKASGRGTYRFYSEEMNKKTVLRLKLESALHRALERQELFLEYQPQLEVKTGQVIGVEALVRWNHPELGRISPMDFIPLAEETGLILPIGEWILKTACSEMKAFYDQQGLFLKLAVNLSPRQFQQAEFAHWVDRILLETHFPPHHLELEITESCLIEDPQGATLLIQRLRGLGIQISIDDFGTGYSNLSYLRQFPANLLKIDQSFIDEVDSRPDSLAIVQAVIQLARSLKMEVIAEGVETSAQLETLTALECDMIQGYHLSRPVSLNGLNTFMTKKTP